jgi:hypothetical protein
MFTIVYYLFQIQGGLHFPPGIPNHHVQGILEAMYTFPSPCLTHSMHTVIRL